MDIEATFVSPVLLLSGVLLSELLQANNATAINRNACFIVFGFVDDLCRAEEVFEKKWMGDRKER